MNCATVITMHWRSLISHYTTYQTTCNVFTVTASRQKSLILILPEGVGMYIKYTPAKNLHKREPLSSSTLCELVVA